MTDDDRARVKGRAARALRDAGRISLAHLDVRQVGESPRQWIGDHDWWVVNVEFQPAGGEVGSYVNVGIQYLWVVTNVRTFGHTAVRERIVGNSRYVGLEGNDAEVAANAAAVGRAARRAVEEILAVRSDDRRHLEFLGDRHRAAAPLPLFDVAVAMALLGRTRRARRVLREIAGRVDPASELAKECERMQSLLPEEQLLRDEICARVGRTRALLKLDPALETGARGCDGWLP